MAAPRVTSLTNPDVQYEVATDPYVVLERGDVHAVVVNNQAVDDEPAPGHRAGYNGVAVLKHRELSDNLFVPNYAGLNFEHIHDGTLAVAREKFEPRRFPMELRIVDENTVELYQAPTPNWKLESCGRYQLLADGTIEYTFECIPRAETFSQGYIGLFWASYIQSPEDKRINFPGHRRGKEGHKRWIRAKTPKHGVHSTHAPAESPALPPVADDFPLTLVNHPSGFVYDEPWYYGVRKNMAYVMMFRARDRIWFAQSPTGGGATNPAWDFQWFIRNYTPGEAYGFVMRCAYLPTTERTVIEQRTRKHRAALNPPAKANP